MAEPSVNSTFPLIEVLPGWFEQFGLSRERNEAVEDDMNKLFCSKTIAVCYKKVGLLSQGMDTSGIFPKHWSQPHDPFMGYLEGAHLGREIDISFESSPLLRELSLRLLRATMARKRFCAALIIQRVYRSSRAHRLRADARKASQPTRRFSKRISHAFTQPSASSSRGRQMTELKRLTQAKLLLARGVLIDDV